MGWFEREEERLRREAVVKRQVALTQRREDLWDIAVVVMLSNGVSKTSTSPTPAADARRAPPLGKSAASASLSRSSVRHRSSNTGSPRTAGSLKTS